MHWGLSRAVRALVGASIGVGGLGIVLGSGACSGKKNNEVVVTLQTDLTLPRDVDKVRIEVLQGANVLFMHDYDVGPDGARIPATLGVVDPNNSGKPVQVRVIARQKGTLRVLRRATTTIPAERTAMLRMPIHWLCWNHDQDPSDGGDPQPSCPDGQSCIAGTCTNDTVDPKTLPAFSPAQVFGGGAGGDSGTGTCFDTVACMSAGNFVDVDLPTCSMAKPSGGSGINVAMVRKAGTPGICNGNACYVPVDQDPEFGWSVSTTDPTRITLPAAVCQRLQLPDSDKLSILGVAVSTACQTKDESVPTCGPWSSVGGDAGSEIFPDAGANAAVIPDDDAAPPPAPAVASDGGGGDAAIALPDGGTCSAVTRWPEMLAAPITPTSLAGLDFTAGNLTLSQCNDIDCQSRPSPSATPTNQAVIWGNKGDVYAEFAPSSQLLQRLVVRFGYTGTLTFTSRDGAHTYVVGIGTLTKDGTPMTVDWTTDVTPVASELYDAYIATFAPNAPKGACALLQNVGGAPCYFQPPNGAQDGVIGFSVGANMSIGFATGRTAPSTIYVFPSLYTPPAPAVGNDAGAPVDAGGD
jgi:hypothetical protein